VTSDMWTKSMWGCQVTLMFWSSLNESMNIQASANHIPTCVDISMTPSNSFDSLNAFSCRNPAICSKLPIKANSPRITTFIQWNFLFSAQWKQWSHLESFQHIHLRREFIQNIRLGREFMRTNVELIDTWSSNRFWNAITMTTD
jgi:hypothetical protein